MKERDGVYPYASGATGIGSGIGSDVGNATVKCLCCSWPALGFDRKQDIDNETVTKDDYQPATQESETGAMPGQGSF